MRERRGETSRWDESSSADSLCCQMNEFRQKTLNSPKSEKFAKAVIFFFFYYCKLHTYAKHFLIK